jgi:NADH-quinone oxidoreductase subunit M
MDWLYDRLYPGLRIGVLWLVLLPLLAALAMPLLGSFARRAALYAALLHLIVAAFVVFGAIIVLDERGENVRTTRDTAPQQFRPHCVPGDPGISGVTNGTMHRTRFTLLSLTDQPAFDTTGMSTKYFVGPRVEFFLGVDGLNLWLVVLCSIMMLPVILISWDSVIESPGQYYGWMFLLQTGAIGAFLSFDVILFYVFFELTLIPAFFLIARWGSGSGRRDAARKFFLYTLAGSLLTLVGIIGVVLTNPDPLTGQYTFSLPDLMYNVQLRMIQTHVAHLQGSPEALASRQDVQFWLFLALIAGFLVKTPIWPFHTWLPSAYSEAPLGVTILLSSLLAKLGAYGILRLVLTLTPDAAIAYGLPVVGTLAAIGIVYGSLCAFGQRDIKLMIAYGSIAHLGFLVLGLFAFNPEGISGASLHMVNHGIATGAMFALLAFFVHRYRTTDMRQFGGLLGRFPKFAFLAFVICLASIGLPGLNNFVSEMMMLAGLFDARNDAAVGLGLPAVAAASIFLSAWYVLTMLQRMFFNAQREPPPVGPLTPSDVNNHEVYTLGGLAALCLFLGLFPQLLIAPMKADAAIMGSIGDLARDRVAGRFPDLGPGYFVPPARPVEPNGKEPIPPKKKGAGPKAKAGLKAAPGEE